MRVRAMVVEGGNGNLFSQFLGFEQSPQNQKTLLTIFHLFLPCITMKFIALAASFLAGASAFAPTTTMEKSIAMNAASPFADGLGSVAPTGKLTSIPDCGEMYHHKPLTDRTTLSFHRLL